MKTNQKTSMFSKGINDARRRAREAGKARRAEADEAMNTGWSALKFWRGLASDPVLPSSSPALKRYHD